MRAGEMRATHARLHDAQMVDDESRVGVAIDQRRALVQVAPEQDVDWKSCFTAAPRVRSRPGSFGSRFASFVSMMRIPTVPGVFFQSAMTSATAGSSGSTGLLEAQLVYRRRVLSARVGGDVQRAVRPPLCP